MLDTYSLAAPMQTTCDTQNNQGCRWINDSTLFTFAGKVSVIYTACLRMLRDVFGQQVTMYYFNLIA
jgi:hypothetical protein